MNSEDTDNKSLNRDVLKTIQITSQEHILIKSLEKFYEDTDNMDIMLPIVKGYSNISMRLIDYFVTNYSKKHRVSYNIKSNNNTYIFNVYSSYKSQLKAFNKKYFDPFSRGNRIPFFFPDDCIITTIGQLNFFKWFISHKIIDYVKENLEDIENDLDLTKNQTKKNKIKKKTIRSKKPSNYVRKCNYSMKPVKQVSLDGSKRPVNIVVTFE